MDIGIVGRLRFGDFELDGHAERLYRAGRLVKIQPQPLRVLKILVDRRGEIVSREELRASIWGEATFVEFDQGLNYCIRQIRLALHDEASKPAYVETLPKQGYRFIAPCVEEESPAPLVPLSPPTGQSASAHRPYIWYVTVPAMLMLLGATVWWTMGRGSSGGLLRVTRVTKLTTYPGDEREPAISPDGAYVAFSWSGEKGDNYDIYVVRLGAEQPLRLTQDPALDSYPAWSPDGRQIAFVRRKGTEASIVVVPMLGGPERTLYRGRMSTELDLSQQPALSWSPDGKSIVFTGQSGETGQYVLSVLSMETGAVSVVSSPGADLLGDASPAVSPDGRSLAFVRYLAPLNGRVLLQPLSAGLRPEGRALEATDAGLALRSPAWVDDGLLFADRERIFQWKRNKGAVPIYAADGTLGGLSLGPKGLDGGRQMVVASERVDCDIWALALNAEGTQSTGPPYALQRSTAPDGNPNFSPDGRYIAFVSLRSGTSEIWVADADGQHARQLTRMGAHVTGYPKWSPDSRRIAFHARVPDVAQIYVVDVNQGVPRQITHENPGLAIASWSRDSRFLYATTLTATGATIFRLRADGGPKERLWEGTMQVESLDGKRLLYSRLDEPGIYSRSLEGDLSRNPEELVVADFWSRNQIGNFAPAQTGIYYVGIDAQGKPGPFRFVDYASRTSMDVAPPMPGLCAGMTVAPDRRHLAFSARAELGGNLLLLELRP